MSSLKYHSLAKHIADAESPPPPRQMQTTLDSLQRRHLDNPTSKKLSTAIAKWEATACRPNIVPIITNLHLQKKKQVYLSTPMLIRVLKTQKIFL